MTKRNIIKAAIAAIVFTGGFLVFSFTAPKSEMQTLKAKKTPAKTSAGLSEINGYKKWSKVSKDKFIMEPVSAEACFIPTRKIPTEGSDLENSPHKDKYINVYVNTIGESEMLTKKNPKFPVGTVIVKEKLATPDTAAPELLTVMIKRRKGFNPEVGDWEFAATNGAGTEVDARGKLQSCQACHIGYQQNDYISRIYLTDEVNQKLK